MKNVIMGMPALILIDIQKAFDDVKYWGGQRNNVDAEMNASRLLTHWRIHSLPVFHVRHCSSNVSSPLHVSHLGNQFKEEVKPLLSETVIDKNVNSAFIGTSLESLLRSSGIDTVVLAGLTTDHCVSTTARMAGNLGFRTFVVSDATATFCKKGLNGQYYAAELIHETALISLNDEFATIVSTQDFLSDRDFGRSLR